jgi:uncharacterized protein YndB with AHSA1/START domain
VHCPGSSQVDTHIEEFIVSQPTPLHFVFYFAAPPDTVWEGFVSPESNRVIFMGAELEIDLKPGGVMNWFGPGADGKRAVYVRGEVLQAEPSKLLQYTFALGSSSKTSRVTLELVPETEATKVSITHDQWTEDDPGYASCTDGWPRILSRLKTLIETGKTFKPH